MQPNLWLYANSEEQQSAAASHILFGVEVFKKAKLICDIGVLKIMVTRLEKGDMNIKSLSPSDKNILLSFSQEYLIDCVRIIIFFENYMKAELIAQGFCVHVINKDFNNFEEIAKEQYKRPITIKEINDIKAFKMLENREMFSHDALKETTLGIKILLGSSEYLKHYHLKKNMIEHLKEINLNRNKLHFYKKIEFTFSESFISKIELLIEFVKNIRGKIQVKEKEE